MQHFKIETSNPQRLKDDKALTSVGIFSQFPAGLSDLPETETPAQNQSVNEGLTDPYGVKY